MIRSSVCTWENKAQGCEDRLPESSAGERGKDNPPILKNENQTTTQPEQHPPWPSSCAPPAPPYAPGRPLPEVGIAGRPVCCSCITNPDGRSNKESVITHLVILPDLTDKITESFIDVDALLCRRFNELAAKVFGKVTALYLRDVASTTYQRVMIKKSEHTVHTNLSFVLQIAFIGDHNDGERVLVFYS